MDTPRRSISLLVGVLLLITGSLYAIFISQQEGQSHSQDIPSPTQIRQLTIQQANTEQKEANNGSRVEDDSLEEKSSADNNQQSRLIFKGKLEALLKKRPSNEPKVLVTNPTRPKAVQPNESKQPTPPLHPETDPTQQRTALQPRIPPPPPMPQGIYAVVNKLEKQSTHKTEQVSQESIQLPPSPSPPPLPPRSIYEVVNQPNKQSNQPSHEQRQQIPPPLPLKANSKAISEPQKDQRREPGPQATNEQPASPAVQHPRRTPDHPQPQHGGALHPGPTGRGGKRRPLLDSHPFLRFCDIFIDEGDPSQVKVIEYASGFSSNFLSPLSSEQ